MELDTYLERFYDNQPLEEQTQVLAEYLMAEHGGPWRSMGAIEMAMRLLEGERADAPSA